ncbi:MAG TPA: 50S ribosomal protein L6 [bacterium]|uniref:Large ribosomal subunit protein uL6 n=1 Tax=uncultured bacterium Rifle_16ft_4_minimus_4564 TaxID=1665161 RepID=A0A0H4T8S2_9BACT|nr:50S ribosomal protein L6, large subunit ribosomal protein L6 [uncultured bacterium Rifle_16ft_4_minimus_4564]
MSRIGKTPVNVPKEVTISVSSSNIAVKGPKGSMNWKIPAEIRCEVKDNTIYCTRQSNEPRVRALHGLTRARIYNMVTGVTAGFEKLLDIIGVGYKADISGKDIVLNLGYSHPIKFKVPEGISIKVEKGTRIIVSGVDKALVGEIAAKIRELREPDSYKGKGIRYFDEKITLKPGKAATAAGAGTGGGK